ncbi:MAG: hypothetical protein ACHP84_00835 [Caulobacterales bacterium]
MAVLIEALSVVVRRETIARRYAGGWPGYQADAVNRSLCADSEIARLGFMHPDHVGAFIRHLERHGFVFQNSAGEAVDIVVVDQRVGPTTPCAWIDFFRHDIADGTVSAARLKNSSENNLICPDGWKYEHSLSRQFKFYPGTDISQHLDLVRSEQDLRTFRDRLTGEEVYLRDQGPTEAASEAPTDAIVAEYNASLADAGQLLGPYIGPDRPVTPEEIAQVARAIAELERLVTIAAKWSSWWLLGIGRRALDDRQGAYAAFSRAYGLAPKEVEVGRNLVVECITLGYGDEAIAVAEAVIALAPNDPGHMANYALALLIGAKPDRALLEIKRAEQIDPSDEVIGNVRELIENVCAGRAERPSNILL